MYRCDLCQAFGKPQRIVMIICQPVDMMIEREEACRCQNTNLPHAATDQFANTVCPTDKICRPDQNRTRRCAKAL